MAHSDTLIFLTNVTWTFFLFLLIYLVFVLFFIPSFFKKIRLFVASREGWVLDGFYALISIPATLSNVFYLFNEVVKLFNRFISLVYLFLALDQFIVKFKVWFFDGLLRGFFVSVTADLCMFVNFDVRLGVLGFVVDGGKCGVYFIK